MHKQENLQIVLMISNLTKEELDVLRNVSIHSIIGVQNNGRQIKISCPVHKERTPSFTLYPDNGFKCFGCGIQGRGALDFVMALGYTFPEAIEELAKYL